MSKLATHLLAVLLFAHPAIGAAASLVGQVVDTHGIPVPMARVGLGEMPDPWVDGVGVRADLEGFFELLDVPAGRPLELWVQRYGVADHRRVLEPLAPGERRELEVVVKPTGRIGYVLDEQHRPVFLADVLLHCEPEDRSRIYWYPFHYQEASIRHTDAWGRFVVPELSPRGATWPCTLWIVADGFGVHRASGLGTFEELGELLGVFELRPEAVVEGRVVDAEGRPMPGIRLRLRSRTYDRKDVFLGRSWRLTGPRGELRFDGLRPGELLHLDLVAPEYRPVWRDLELEAGVGMAPLEIVLERRTRFEGRLIDERGHAVARAHVLLERSGGSEGPWPGDLEEDGSFVVHGAPAGPATLRVGAEGFQVLRRPVDVPAPGGEGTPVEVVLRLEPGLEVEPRPVDGSGDDGAQR